MSRDVSFSISPDGLEEVISAMTATVAVEPYDTFATTWAKVGMCLLHARLVATRHDRRVLARLEHLTVLGVWHATVLDVPPHPKLPGYCLIRARDPSDVEPCNWNYLIESAHSFQEDCISARKVLSTLAWHLSLRRNRDREFQWSRTAADLVQKMLQVWRHERIERMFN